MWEIFNMCMANSSALSSDSLLKFYGFVVAEVNEDKTQERPVAKKQKEDVEESDDDNDHSGEWNRLVAFGFLSCLKTRRCRKMTVLGYWFFILMKLSHSSLSSCMYVSATKSAEVYRQMT